MFILVTNDALLTPLRNMAITLPKMIFFFGLTRTTYSKPTTDEVTNATT